MKKKFDLYRLCSDRGSKDERAATWQLFDELRTFTLAECGELLHNGCPALGIAAPLGVALSDPKMWTKDKLCQWAAKWRPKLVSWKAQSCRRTVTDETDFAPKAEQA